MNAVIETVRDDPSDRVALVVVAATAMPRSHRLVVTAIAKNHANTVTDDLAPDLTAGTGSRADREIPWVHLHRRVAGTLWVDEIHAMEMIALVAAAAAAVVGAGVTDHPERIEGKIGDERGRVRRDSAGRLVTGRSDLVVDANPI